LLSLIDHFHLHHSADLRRLRAGSSGHLLPSSPPAGKATDFRMKIALNYPWR